MSVLVFQPQGQEKMNLEKEQLLHNSYVVDKGEVEDSGLSLNA